MGCPAGHSRRAVWAARGREAGGRPCGQLLPAHTPLALMHSSGHPLSFPLQCMQKHYRAGGRCSKRARLAPSAARVAAPNREQAFAV